MTDHTLTPTEYELPNNDLAVAEHVSDWFSTRAVTVPSEKRPLYRLLLEVLESVRVPDLMPARLARECLNLVEARDAVEAIERGVADIGGAGYGMSYCYRVRDAIVDYRERDPIRLVAVGCSGSKDESDGLLPPKDRYQGGYWTNKREYYEAFCDDGGRVISAEHGLLHPETEIEYYERVPGDLEGIPVDSSKRLPSGDDVDTLLDQWALEVHESLTTWLCEVANGVDPRDVHLDILLGEERYAEPLRERGVFGALRIQGDLEIAFPFRDASDAKGGIGKQRGWMCDQVEAAVATDGGTDQ